MEIPQVNVSHMDKARDCIKQGKSILFLLNVCLMHSRGTVCNNGFLRSLRCHMHNIFFFNVILYTPVKMFTILK